MDRNRISSIPALTVLAFFTTMLPLVAALVVATWYVNSITAEGQSAIQRATRSANAAQQLGEVITSMERSARQYHVLKDRSLLEMVEDQHLMFLAGVAQLQPLPIQAEFYQELERVAELERSIYKRLLKIPMDSRQVSDVLKEFTTLATGVRNIQIHSGRFVRNSIGELQLAAAKATDLMFWLSIALVPGVLVIAVIFVVVIVRPIRQLDRAIHQLGNGELSVPVRVSGPLDLQALGERLDWMRNRLQDVDNQKALFLRHVSHELKTPLTSLREGSDLLADEVIGPLNEEQAEVAQILRHNSEQLLQQIEALLQFNSTQTRHLLLERQHFRFDSLISNVIQAHRLRIRSKRLKLVTELSPVYLDGDREKLHTVVDNLLSNAVKFSPLEGTLRVLLSRTDDQVLLRVIDEGPGIAKEDRPKIFEAFYQGEIQTPNPVKGSGLGLSIARAFVELHQGTIELADSETGTEMQVSLPLSSPRLQIQHEESHAL